MAARGLDIKGLPFVINMTLPSSAEGYIHRIGTYDVSTVWCGVVHSNRLTKVKCGGCLVYI